MITIHASGHLLRDPQARTTKTGGEFATCMLAVGDDTVVNIACFDADLCALLMRCKKGDGLSVAGKATVGTYQTKTGETRPSVSVTANRIMTAAAEGMARPKPKRERDHQAYGGSYPPPDRPFNDDPPF